MTIADENYKGEVNFQSLKYGDVFKVSNNCYMKIPEQEGKNAVNLSTGNLTYYPFNALVICFPYAELYLERENKT